MEGGVEGWVSQVLPREVHRRLAEPQRPRRGEHALRLVVHDQVRRWLVYVLGSAPRLPNVQIFGGTRLGQSRQ